jgi:cytochrome c oxidase subunit III
MSSTTWNATGGAKAAPGQAMGIGLWVFMGVATALFSLFLLANLMRMTASDWWPLTLPWQLWLSTALLVAGSVCLHQASASAYRQRADTPRWLIAGGACAFGFLVVQWWAWQALLGAGVSAAGNPAGSFFYVLTALHGMHVIGGLIAWTVTARTLKEGADAAWRIRLCARYWHFLLAVWVVLFAAIGLLTPDIARAICGPLRIA